MFKSPLSPAVAPSVTAGVSPPGPVVVGDMVDLVCEATAGDTPISFTWTDDGGMDVSQGDTDGTISLTLSSAGYGTYTCTATNAIGMDTSNVEVVQAGTKNTHRNCVQCKL